MRYEKSREKELLLKDFFDKDFVSIVHVLIMICITLFNAKNFNND